MLVGTLNNFHASFLLEFELHCIDAAALDFLIFKTPDTLLFTLSSHSVHGIWPLSYTCL